MPEVEVRFEAPWYIDEPTLENDENDLDGYLKKVFDAKNIRISHTWGDETVDTGG